MRYVSNKDTRVYYRLDFDMIKMPPPILKCGRPKGFATTVIGLPAKKKTVHVSFIKKPVPFISKCALEKEEGTCILYTYICAYVYMYTHIDSIIISVSNNLYLHFL